MPAEIPAAKQAKIIELAQAGLTLTQIGESVGVSRNTVSRIVRTAERKVAPDPNLIRDLTYTPAELFKLNYLLEVRVGIAGCPRCDGDCGYMVTDTKATCKSCNIMFGIR